MRTNGILSGTLEHFTGDAGTIHGAAKLADKVDNKLKEGKAKYRIEYIREDAPLRPGDIATGNVEVFDEVSKEGIRAIAKGILSSDNKNFNEDTRVDLNDVTGYTKLLKEAATDQRKGYIKRRKNEIKTELNDILGNVITNVPFSPEATPLVLGNYNWERNDMFNGIDESTKKRINRLKKEFNQLDGRIFGQKVDTKAPTVVSSLENDLADISELEKRNRERDQKRQDDWDNSAVGRMTNAVGNLTYNISGGRWGTHTEKLTAGKSVDGSELKYRKQYLLKLFKSKGLSDGAAAGIIGNLEGEGLSKDPSQHFKDPTKKDPNAYSQGIAMFNSRGELPNLQSWSKKKGLDYNTFEAQAQYVANHSVVDKILKETQGLNPQDSLKKSAIIWGHDFERFKGYDAADSHGNLIGRGGYISITANSKDKYREDGKLHGDENYAERIQKGLNTYNTYSGSDLSEINIESSRKFIQGTESGGIGSSISNKARSFLDILKEKVTNFIMGLSGLGGESAKEEEPKKEAPKTVAEINKDKSALPEMTDYETYLKNQDNLPEGIPKGLSHEEWNALTNKADIEQPVTELREDSKNILGKYTKSENSEFFDQKIKNIEDQEYEKDIPLLEDPVFRNTHSEEYIANVQRVKEEKEKESVAEQKTNPEVEIKPLEIETPKTSVSGILSALAGEYEKKKDMADIVETGFSDVSRTLGMISRINSTNGIIAAKNVDATRMTAQVINNSSARTAQTERTRYMNQVREGRSLIDQNNQTVKQISEKT